MTAVKNVHLTKKSFFIFFLLLLNSPRNIYCRKSCFEAIQLSCFSSLSGYKEDTTSLCARPTLLEMQNSSFQSTVMRRRQNFEKILKVTQQSMEFSFPFLSSPLILLFLPHFFPFAGHLVGFISIGKVLGKAFRILGQMKRMVGGVKWSRSFMQIFGSTVQSPVFFFPFLLFASLTESCSFQYGLKDLFTLSKLADLTLSLNGETDDVTSGSGAHQLKWFKILWGKNTTGIPHLYFTVRCSTGLVLKPTTMLKSTSRI